jgi:hypothetical protein
MDDIYINAVFDETKPGYTNGEGVGEEDPHYYPEHTGQTGVL